MWPFEFAGENNIVKLGTLLNQINAYVVTEGMDGQVMLCSFKYLLKGRALQYELLIHAPYVMLCINKGEQLSTNILFKKM